MSIGFCGSILRINCCDTYAKPQAEVNLTDLCGVQFLFWAQTNFLHTFKSTTTKRANRRKLDRLMSSYLFMKKWYLIFPHNKESVSLMNQTTKSISKKFQVPLKFTNHPCHIFQKQGVILWVVHIITKKCVWTMFYKIDFTQSSRFILFMIVLGDVLILFNYKHNNWCVSSCFRI